MMYLHKRHKKCVSLIKYFTTFFTLVFSLTVVSNWACAVDIATSAEDIKPILIGQALPPITLKDRNNKPFDLNKATSQKPTLLIFYRGGWCPYCNTHLSNLRKIEGELLAMGFQIIAISPDQPQLLSKTVSKHKLSYQVLSDSYMNAAKALGLAYKVDSKTLKKLDSYGIDIEKSAGQSHHLLPVPAALLVNTKGEVTFTFITPNYKIRVDNEVVLAAAKSQINSKMPQNP